MILGKRLRGGWLLVAMLGCFAWILHAQSPDITPDSTLDTLVYKDGDRIHGHVVKDDGKVIVFKSERFGELRVASKDAVVIKAEKPEPEAKHVVAQGIHAAPAAETPQTPKEREEEEKITLWDRFSPAVLTAKVRDFFGPWHGRVAVADDVVTDTSKRDNLSVEGKLSRKFTNDTVDLGARYDYDRTDNEVTTDLFRSTGSWRHDFSKKYFSQYRPTLEINHANSTNGGLPSDYVLLQQELGLGFNLFNRPGRKVRVGASGNLFDLWSSVPNTPHSSRTTESLFDEVELALPWRMALTQRGVWYPESHNGPGWEDQLELNKKLTETLSVAIRHEIRRNNPDGASHDYTRLRLLLGLDF